MLDKKCMLIFYSRGIYDGAALALAEEIKSAHKDIYVVTVADDEISPWKYSIIRRRSFIFCARNMPLLNKMSYGIRQLFAVGTIKKSKKEYKEFKKPTGGFGKWIYSIRIKYRRVYNAMLRFDPEVVICTTPELLAKVNKARHQLGSINMSVCALITDYQLDKRFVHYKTDGYFVPNESVKQGLIKYNIDEDAITVVNLPLSSAMMCKHDREFIIEKLGINPARKNLLLIGGRYGSAAIKECYMRLADLASEYNIVILSGESDGLAKYCSYIAGSKNIADNVYVVEKVENMSELYSIADSVICSPTAYITLEAIYHNCKIVLIKGADSMEKLNAHYLTTNSLALQGNNAEEIIASLDKYESDSEFVAATMAAQSVYMKGEVASLSEMVYQINCLLADEKLATEQKRQLIMSGGNLLDGSTLTPGQVAELELVEAEIMPSDNESTVKQ